MKTYNVVIDKLTEYNRKEGEQSIETQTTLHLCSQFTQYKHNAVRVFLASHLSLLYSHGHAHTIAS